MGRCRQPPLRTASGRRCGSGPGAPGTGP